MAYLCVRYTAVCKSAMDIMTWCVPTIECNNHGAILIRKSQIVESFVLPQPCDLGIGRSFTLAAY
jgi:hypothetical protein